MESGREYVHIDLEKFFDRINHDVLMSRVACKVNDKRVGMEGIGWFPGGIDNTVDVRPSLPCHAA